MPKIEGVVTGKGTCFAWSVRMRERTGRGVHAASAWHKRLIMLRKPDLPGNCDGEAA